MPKLSDSTRESRRRHVMVSAWKCFSRQGFQSTTMDEIIAETGMSSSSVYRYFAGKDELIGSAAEESLTTTRAVLNELRQRRPVAGPRETLDAIVGALHRQIDQPDYDLSKITVNAWVEALRRPEMHERAYRFYRETHKTLVQLARLWQSEGLVATGGDPTAIADLFIALMPGMIVIHHLYKPASATRLADGMVAFAEAQLGGAKNSSAMPSGSRKLKPEP
jgi:AcrR family transcriptional regulator